MISLVITVKNEKDNIADWLTSLEKQTTSPDEIIIVDGGSVDGTWEYLKERSSSHKSLRVFQKEGNIAVGRNAGIGEASGEYIVVTDAGCVYAPDWFKNISEPLVSETVKFASTAFGPWLKESDGFLVYGIAASTIPQKSEFNKDWLPSSRSVAFTKDLWHSVGGYPEWIPYCEDVIFDLKLQEKWGKPCYIRQPLVFWRPRQTMKAYLKQLYNYTRSDGHGKLFTGRQLIRYGVYSLSLVLIILATYKSILFLLPLLGMVFYMNKFWKRWFVFSGKKSLWFKIIGIVTLPFIVGLGDCAKMAGYPVGVYERISKKIK